MIGETSAKLHRRGRRISGSGGPRRERQCGPQSEPSSAGPHLFEQRPIPHHSRPQAWKTPGQPCLPRDGDGVEKIIDMFMGDDTAREEHIDLRGSGRGGGRGTGGGSPVAMGPAAGEGTGLVGGR
jgi:hypothetical protein